MKASHGKKQQAIFTVECRVSRGMFTRERGILVSLIDGSTVFALVDRRHVSVEKEPVDGQDVPGKVTVHLINRSKKSAIVDLPEPGITVGPRIEVSTELLG